MSERTFDAATDGGSLFQLQQTIRFLPQGGKLTQVMNNVQQKQHQRQQHRAAPTVSECLFILWSKLVVKVHATWKHLACKNPGAGQRGFKKYSEAAIRSPNT